MCSQIKEEENTMETKLIYKRISSVMAEIDAVSKEQVNQVQRFKYRSIDDIYNALSKIMAKHEVFSTVEILNRERTPIKSKGGGEGYHLLVQFKFTFHTTDGSFIQTFIDGEAADYGDKVSNKALSVAHKYALITLFCIPTAENKDADRFTPDVNRQAQQTGEKLPQHIQILKSFESIGVTKDSLEEFLEEPLSEKLPQYKLDLLRSAFIRARNGETIRDIANDLKEQPNVNELF